MMNDDQPETVRFARGRVPSVAPGAKTMEPGARGIAPGETVTGSAEVPLPLVAAHWRGTVAPLAGTPRFAVLHLGVITGEAHWRQIPLADGSTLTLPASVDPMPDLVSDRLPIPP